MIFEEDESQSSRIVRLFKCSRICRASIWLTGVGQMSCFLASATVKMLQHHAHKATAIHKFVVSQRIEKSTTTCIHVVLAVSTANAHAPATSKVEEVASCEAMMEATTMKTICLQNILCVKRSDCNLALTADVVQLVV